MSCSGCHRDVKIIARGYCRACYQRWQKRGTTEYAPPRHRTFCHIDDCGRPVVSNGMCDMHRNRLRKTGTTDQSSWGAHTKHPLYNSWCYLRRHAGQHPMCESWQDFLTFAIDLGERPSSKHRLYSANDAFPIGPDNYVWKEAVTQRVDGEDERTYMNRAQRVYRAVRKEAFQGYETKKRYGLSSADVAAMFEAQGWVCAVCEKAETVLIRGAASALAIDHCHTTGAIRGLLCSKCNRGIGMFLDSPDILRAAIAYLEKHRCEGG